MDIENRLRPDLWKAIQAHYERTDFTEAVRDAVFHVNELLREKSGHADKDGNKLVDAAMMGKEPAILVSKNETTTEKDFQMGIAYALKGIMSGVRNPLSHEKMQYGKDDAEAIILYINYLLNQIDNSGGFNKVENILELLYDEDFTPTAEYAELLLKEVPVRKRYDLLVQLFQERENLQEGKLQYFIEALYNSLTKASKTHFIRLLNGELMICKDDYLLRMYIHYFMKFTYAELDRLIQLRIEDFLLKAVKAGKMIDTKRNGEKVRVCVDEASLATWLDDPELICLLGNTDSLFHSLMSKLRMGGDYAEFALDYFTDFMAVNIRKMDQFDVYILNKMVENGNEAIYEFLDYAIGQEDDEMLIEWFRETMKAFAEKKRATMLDDDSLRKFVVTAPRPEEPIC